MTANRQCMCASLGAIAAVSTIIAGGGCIAAIATATGIHHHWALNVYRVGCLQTEAMTGVTSSPSIGVCCLHWRDGRGCITPATAITGGQCNPGTKDKPSIH
jgi:hypothetical protein